MTRPEVEVRHGYSLDHLQALARLCATRAFSATLGPFDRADVAWCAIVEALYTATERPTPAELLRAGTRAIHDDSWADQHAHGFRKLDRQAGDGANHRWAMYWLGVRSFPSPETGVVDRISMVQIWPLLSPWMQEALVALAVHDDYQRAADSLGLKYQTYCARVQRARVRFFRAWHEHETPPSRQRDQRTFSPRPSRRRPA